MTRGIGEVPLHLDRATRDFLTDLRETVIQLRLAQSAPRTVLNLQATPIPGGNRVQWTTTDADYYQVYWSPNQNFANAMISFIGTGGQYQDNIGSSGITRYYWVLSLKYNGKQSPAPAGPVQSTSAALAVNVPPAPSPVPGDQIVVNLRSGILVPRGPIR